MLGTKRFQHLSGQQAALPITEKSNPLTKDLGRNAELTRLYSKSVLTTVVQGAVRVHEVLKFLRVSSPPQPEDLSGSSQKRGGSATKILLETLMLAAQKAVDQGIAASQR
ncbi:hypothetical protein MC885_021877 [Smutsia gigantea]|nr:hypothetical protein MC885_021877 [Smutsia gigantea]